VPNGIIFAILYPLVFLAVIALVVYAVVKKDVKPTKVTLGTALHLLGVFTAFIGLVYFAVEVDLPKLAKVLVLFAISGAGIVYGHRMSRKS
jgi:hypothetical protein